MLAVWHMHSRERSVGDCMAADNEEGMSRHCFCEVLSFSLIAMLEIHELSVQPNFAKSPRRPDRKERNVVPSFRQSRRLWYGITSIANLLLPPAKPPDETPWSRRIQSNFSATLFSFSFYSLREPRRHETRRPLSAPSASA